MQRSRVPRPPAPGLRRALPVLMLALGAALFSCSWDPRTSARGCPPDCNVVLISIDTLRADHLGIHGDPRDTSPNLDRFAGEAFVFENAISQSAWTTPAQRPTTRNSLIAHKYRTLLSSVLREPTCRRGIMRSRTGWLLAVLTLRARV